MNRIQLFAIANLMAAICCVWAWQQWSAAGEKSDFSSNRLETCQELCSKIQIVERQAASNLTVMPVDFDPGRDIQQRWQQSGLDVSAFNVSEYQTKMNEELEMKRWGIKLAGVNTSLSGAVRFVESLANSDAKIQVGGLRLNRVKKESATGRPAQERWAVSFDEVTYLKKDSPSAGGKRR